MYTKRLSTTSIFRIDNDVQLKIAIFQEKYSDYFTVCSNGLVTLCFEQLRACLISMIIGQYLYLSGLLDGYLTMREQVSIIA